MKIDAFKGKKCIIGLHVVSGTADGKVPREILGITDVVQYNSNVVFNNMVAGTKAALENGVKVGLGTDTGCPYTTHYNMWRELKYFTKYVGVTPEFALYTATLGNAEIAGLDAITGSIEVGKSADILVAVKNPLDDFEKIWRFLIMVWQEGRFIKKSLFKKYAKM